MLNRGLKKSSSLEAFMSLRDPWKSSRGRCQRSPQNPSSQPALGSGGPTDQQADPQKTLSTDNTEQLEQEEETAAQSLR